MYSEIHTFYEVMLMLSDQGVEILQALNPDSPLDVAEFEYPSPYDIPS